MANRNFNRVQALDKEIKLIAGSFAPNGSSAVSSSSITGLGFSVARSGVGTFRITLQDYYVALQAAVVSLQLATPDDKFVQIGASAITTTAKYVDVVVWDVGSAAAADISPAAGNQIHFSLHLRNSTVGN